jgi:HD-GYP domain-containing protein (c-di-GMP phosphodiesterase class II)
MSNTAGPSGTRLREPAVSHRDVFPVQIDSIEDGFLEMDLYLHNRRRERLVLYRAVGVEFTQAHRDALRDQGTEVLYVPVFQHHAYQRMFAARLERIRNDPEMVRSEQTRLVRAQCTKVMDDVLHCPDQQASFGLVASVSGTFEDWVSEDWEGFAQLMDIAEHDYYTATHMFNVGIGCGVLAQRLMPEQPRLVKHAIHAGLLHDLGKRDIPEGVLNKEGRLEPREWAMIHAHPHRGRELMAQHAGIPFAVLRVAESHHERIDGSGYPNGLKDSQIEPLARICAIVDTFDAIRSARPYRPAIPPAQAIATLRSAMDTHFDRGMTECWCDIVAQLYGAETSGESTGKSSAPVLGDFIQQCPAPVGAWGRTTDPAAGKQRRRHPRYGCATIVTGRFAWQGKDYPVAPGVWTEFKTVDVSRGGLQIVTPWPLAINDVLEFRLPGPNGRQTCRMAAVIRIRKTEQGEWRAGLMFVSERPPSAQSC